MAIAVIAGMAFACRSTPPAVSATREGIGNAAHAPVLRVARDPSPSLGAFGRGQLVVRARVGFSGPIASITIELADSTRAVIARQSTGASGLITFPPLPAGSYSVFARYIGTQPQSAPVRIRAGFVDTLEMQLGQEH